MIAYIEIWMSEFSVLLQGPSIEQLSNKHSYLMDLEKNEKYKEKFQMIFSQLMKHSYPHPQAKDIN